MPRTTPKLSQMLPPRKILKCFKRNQSQRNLSRRLQCRLNNRKRKSSMIGKMQSMTSLRRSHRRQSAKTFLSQRITTKSSHQKKRRKLQLRSLRRRKARKRRLQLMKQPQLYPRLLLIKLQEAKKMPRQDESVSQPYLKQERGVHSPRKKQKTCAAPLFVSWDTSTQEKLLYWTN